MMDDVVLIGDFSGTHNGHECNSTLSITIIGGRCAIVIASAGEEAGG